MDEYLFLTVAKLKADRKKLERELAEQQRRESTHARRPDESKVPPKFFPLLNWR